MVTHRLPSSFSVDTGQREEYKSLVKHSGGAQRGNKSDMPDTDKSIQVPIDSVGQMINEAAKRALIITQGQRRPGCVQEKIESTARRVRLAR